MPAQYPGAIYTPTTKTNRPGVVYDPTKTKVIFAEDFNNDRNEIVAVENELGLNPSGAYDTVDARLSAINGAIPVKATGAEVDTGTDDAKFLTPKAIEDSSYAKTAAIPVKATKAEMAAGTDDAKFLTALAAAELHQLPEGSMLNGKIVPSVAGNNLTVAIKGKDGNDPSATNPVYAMIGGTLRSITAALSVTKNAGTNWFGAGNAETATKEIFYFVYLGYNATDGVVIGFSRIPYALSYFDFSTTNSDSRFCAISAIANAAVTDYYNVIGRFAATLSAGAGYIWTVPTFTARLLVQKPIFETENMNFVPVFSSVGTVPAFTTKIGYYRIIGRTVDIKVTCNGDGGTDGAGANPLLVSTPFEPYSGFSTAMIWGQLSWYGVPSEGNGFVNLSATNKLELRRTVTIPLNCDQFPNGSRWVYIKVSFDVWY
jgi:hypothetical protein